MIMNLVYTDVAIEDLKRLREFIDFHNPLAAMKVAKLLTDKITLLKSFPQIGVPVLQAPDPSTVRDIVFDHYIVRYSLHSQTVIILKIWHTLEQRN